MADRVKQVIVVNMATPMPIGRLMAQAAHASVLNILNRGTWKDHIFTIDTEDVALRWWMEEEFTKVVCKAWGKEAMMKIKETAENKNVAVSLMEEDGFITALALGPALKEELEFIKVLPLM